MAKDDICPRCRSYLNRMGVCLTCNPKPKTPTREKAKPAKANPAIRKK